MKKYIPLFLLIFIFFLLKLPQTQVRLSDTNIYFYTAHLILNGRILYKNIFFTNFPLVPYISSLYLFLSGSNLLLYYATAIFEIAIITSMIYFIVLKEGDSILFAFLSSFLYAFSFIVLVTSDHQTGIYIGCIFSLLAYIFLRSKRLIPCGIFLALSFMTKAYFLPIILSFFVFSIFNSAFSFCDKRKLFLSFLATSVLILLPFLLFSKNELITDVFRYSLTRGAGISKTNVAWFFILHDVFLFILILFNILQAKKNMFFAFVSVFSICFFLLYQDIYYLYLNFTVPFLCISSLYFFQAVQKKYKNILPFFIVIFIIGFINALRYTSSYTTLQTVLQLDEVVKEIQKQKPSVLYGTNDITPALAFLTEVPMLDNVVDTNANIYRKKFLNAKTLTQKAIVQKAIIVAHGAYYPEIGVQQDAIDEIFDPMVKSCTVIKSVPIIAEGIGNRLSLLRCF